MARRGTHTKWEKQKKNVVQFETAHKKKSPRISQCRQCSTNWLHAGWCGPTPTPLEASWTPAGGQWPLLHTLFCAARLEKEQQQHYFWGQYASFGWSWWSRFSSGLVTGPVFTIRHKSMADGGGEPPLQKMSTNLGWYRAYSWNDNREIRRMAHPVRFCELNL